MYSCHEIYHNSVEISTPELYTYNYISIPRCFSNINSFIVVISLWSRRIVDPPLRFAFGGGSGGVQILDAERYIDARQYPPKNYKMYEATFSYFWQCFYGVFFGNGVCVSCIDDMTESYTNVGNKCRS